VKIFAIKYVIVIFLCILCWKFVYVSQWAGQFDIGAVSWARSIIRHVQPYITDAEMPLCLPGMFYFLSGLSYSNFEENFLILKDCSYDIIYLCSLHFLAALTFCHVFVLLTVNGRCFTVSCNVKSRWYF